MNQTIDRLAKSQSVTPDEVAILISIVHRMVNPILSKHLKRHRGTNLDDILVSVQFYDVVDEGETIAGIALASIILRGKSYDGVSRFLTNTLKYCSLKTKNEVEKLIYNGLLPFYQQGSSLWISKNWKCLDMQTLQMIRFLEDNL